MEAKIELVELAVSLLSTKRVSTIPSHSNGETNRSRLAPYQDSRCELGDCVLASGDMGEEKAGGEERGDCMGEDIDRVALAFVSKCV